MRWRAQCAGDRRRATRPGLFNREGIWRAARQPRNETRLAPHCNLIFRVHEPEFFKNGLGLSWSTAQFKINCDAVEFRLLKVNDSSEAPKRRLCNGDRSRLVADVLRAACY